MATFADPDSFYHAKMALLLRDQGVFTQFPWLPFTVLGKSFADHQFLYHVLLIPFVTIWPPLVGLKLATVAFFATAITAFYALLRSWDVRAAGWVTAALLVSSPFLFRLNLAKAQAVAFILLFGFLASLVARRHVHLAVAGFVYVWLYGGWPLLLVLAVMLSVADWVALVSRRWFPAPTVTGPASALSSPASAGSAGRSAHFGTECRRLLAANVKLIAAVAVGIAAGLVVNPYFPHNLYFYWNQIIQIAVINYQQVIGVGGEWYPYPLLELVGATTVATFCAVVGLTVYLLTFRRQPVRSTFLGIVMVFFFAMTLRARRNVEYLIPFEFLFAAVAVDAGVAGLPLSGFWRELRQFLSEQKLYLVALLLPLAILPFIVVRDVWNVRAAYLQGIPFSRFGAVSAWLSANSAPGSVIFHSDWDDFPMLFYYNSHNFYIVGLDATFMYRQDPARYWEWEKITTGRQHGQVAEIIGEHFGARYALVGSEQDGTMGQLLAGQPEFREVYRDGEATVYEVLPQPKKSVSSVQSLGN